MIEKSNREVRQYSTNSVCHLKAHVDTHEKTRRTEAMYNKQKQVNILHSKILSIHTYTFVMAQ